MKLKAVLIDFDGTVVVKDILDVVCGIGGKEAESKKINEEFHKGRIKGRESLITRINYLKGITLQQIYQKLSENDYLMPGAKKLFDFLKSRKIISILYSGNIVSILNYYKEKLGITHIVGTKPKMKGNKIIGISDENFSGTNHKLINIKKILHQYSINSDEVVVIGDSPADKTIFAFAAKSIAINPKEGVESYADYVIKEDLSKVISILNNLLRN